MSDFPHCPDDLPLPVDFDAPARRADLLNDARARLTSGYAHRPLTSEQIDAEIARMDAIRLSMKLAD